MLNARENLPLTKGKLKEMLLHGVSEDTPYGDIIRHVQRLLETLGKYHGVSDDYYPDSFTHGVPAYGFNSALRLVLVIKKITFFQHYETLEELNKYLMSGSEPDDEVCNFEKYIIYVVLVSILQV